MRDAKLRLSLLGILLLTIQLSPCHGLCSLVNGTVARCHNLEDVKYIDTYDLGILKTSASGNRIRAEIFRNLSSLRHLELTQGELQYIENGTFHQLHELRSLDLFDNKIERIQPAAFDGLKKLRTLILRKNALKQIPTAVLSLKNLKVLDVVGNPLDCNCRTLKVRDLLLDRGVYLSKKTLCSTPTNLKGKLLQELDTRTSCAFEEQDAEMQMDEPAVEGSGEVPSGDPFDDETLDELDEEEPEVTDNVTVAATSEEVETPAPTEASRVDDLIVPIEEESVAPSSETVQPEEVETPAPTKSSPGDDLIVPAEGYTAEHSSTPLVTEAPAEKSTSTDDEMFFSEESDKFTSTSPVPSSSTEATEEIPTTKEAAVEELPVKSEIPVEGSGDEEDLKEGSGIEGSGTGVPPIIWDMPDADTETESSSTSSGKDDSWFSLLWNTISGTSVTPDDDTTKELNLQEEQFMNVTTERTSTQSSKLPVDEEVIAPVSVSSSGSAVGKSVDDVEGTDGNVDIGQSLNESKSGQVKAVAEDTAEATDASPARQPQKGMGSYVVLAILLGILGALIGFAAYKGEFCTKKRKRNDVEGGTELKDMTKSLLDPGNGAQPKIASNGNLENVPLVSPPPSDAHQDEPGTLPDGTKSKYSAVPDVIDPVKPPRKSFVSQEDPERALTNGRSHQDLVNSSELTPEVCLRTRGPADPVMNGKNRHDSASSLGTDSRGSPSARTSPPESIPTNGSLGNLQGHSRPPLSPGAQRVKITLQENPDSVPKTPILITRTKAGDNLVKTP